mgnify:CR=1 FL=1
MTKKWLSLFLAAGLALSLAACSSSEEQSQIPEDGDPSVSDTENNQTPDDSTATPDSTTDPDTAPDDTTDTTEPTDPDASTPDQPETKPDNNSSGNAKPSTPETS